MYCQLEPLIPMYMVTGPTRKHRISDFFRRKSDSTITNHHVSSLLIHPSFFIHSSFISQLLCFSACFLNRKLFFLDSCDHIHWFQLLQLPIYHGYLTLNRSHMHLNKQKYLKVMLEPKRSCTLLLGTHCIITFNLCLLNLATKWYIKKKINWKCDSLQCWCFHVYNCNKIARYL